MLALKKLFVRKFFGVTFFSKKVTKIFGYKLIITPILRPSAQC